MVWFWLILGVISCSSSALFIKSTNMDSSLLGAIRLYFAVLLLIPVFIRDWKRCPHLKIKEITIVTLPAGAFLAVHFVSWNMGIRMTLVAHGSLIVNMVPVVLPFILWVSHKEKINRIEVVATVFSMVGIGWLGLHDYHFSKEHVWGDLLCFVSMVFFAVYLSLGRRNRDVGSIVLYMVPVYFIAASGCLLISVPQWSVMPRIELFDLFMAFCLALIPTIFGHTLINYSMRILRGQIVGIMNVGQFLSAGAFAYLFFHELPTATFYVISVFIVFSCFLVVLSHKKQDG